MPDVIPHIAISSVSHSVVSDFLRPMSQPTTLFFSWDSPGKNTGVVCHSLLQRIFPTQRQNADLLHYRQILYCLSYREDPLDGTNPSLSKLFHQHKYFDVSLSVLEVGPSSVGAREDKETKVSPKPLFDFQPKYMEMFDAGMKTTAWNCEAA